MSGGASNDFVSPLIVSVVVIITSRSGAAGSGDRDELRFDLIEAAADYIAVR
jgi:hypothetical protein